jgi:signal transduction histidine kinase
LISGDNVRLQQIFWNILRNAIKFTPENGGIDIETFSTAERFMVTVKDSGIGMTADEISRAFSLFSQGDHTYDGLGLGLAISKRLVDLHLGHIHAFSAGRGHGSCISIEFPLANLLSAANDTVQVASNAQEHQSNPPKHPLVPVSRARQ